ncbi:MAG: hypothetical protein RBS07_15760 [Lentimicrobium sp.]|jgi:hypothetical protein|nr:hypothetical protein [Lentimicrobium sp.]
MVKSEKEIRKDLQKLASQYSPAMTNIARVKSVSVENKTCILLDDNKVEINNVRLLPVLVENKAILKIPADNSLVLAIRLENTENWFVDAVTELEKMQIISGGESLSEVIADLIKAIRAMKFTTNQGPTINLINDPDFAAVQEKFNKIFF